MQRVALAEWPTRQLVREHVKAPTSATHVGLRVVAAPLCRNAPAPVTGLADDSAKELLAATQFHDAIKEDRIDRGEAHDVASIGSEGSAESRGQKTASTGTSSSVPFEIRTAVDTDGSFSPAEDL
jgi:hypothetical protein